jgi:Phosphoglucose isomerase
MRAALANGSSDGLARGRHAKHFVAVLIDAGEVRKFGINAGNMFGFWDRLALLHGLGDRAAPLRATGPEHRRDMLSGFNDGLVGADHRCFDLEGTAAWKIATQSGLIALLKTVSRRRFGRRSERAVPRSEMKKRITIKRS